MLTLLAAGAVLFFAVLAACSHRDISTVVREEIVVQSYYPDDFLMWQHIAEALEPVHFDSAPTAIILPHHAIAANEIGAMWAGITKKVQPEVIFLISPDHFGDGSGKAKTALNVRWATAFGDLRPDTELVNELVGVGLAEFDDESFPTEHGIHIHTAFIKKYFPHARFVPLILGWRSPAERFDRLSMKIAEYMKKFGDKAFVAGSVDFSHYNPRTVANFHDAATKISLSGFFLRDITQKEVDSPATLRSVMLIAQRLGAFNSQCLLNTNSDDFKGIKEISTTSHQFWAFYKGARNSVYGFSVLVSGLLENDAARISSRLAWTWQPDMSVPGIDNPDCYLQYLHGEEDRLLSGADLCLFAFPPVGKLSLWKRESGMLAVLSLDASIEAKIAARRIAEARKKANYLLVTCTHDNSKKVDELMRSFIDAGADAVIGRSYAPPEVFWYKGRPYWTSLGSFAGGHGDTYGEMAGIVFTGDRIDVYRIPIVSENGYPRLNIDSLSK